ncbi:MAG TPA: SDR family NAD(P)-dependent oxidoreductase [Bryobacteraceae bacterium]|nr:SDR family NAD(P)-dependent oxidoreductase [Bryobacteraceae bacterium]
MGRFEEQVVLITGASSGIGAGLAREFAREGAHVVLVARRAERIEELAAELTAAGKRAAAVAGDVTRDGDLERSVEVAHREFGRLDVAIANAGVLTTGRFESLTLDGYRKQIETNTFGALRTAYAALPALRETRGRLVFTGSLLGLVSVPACTAYCMSKFALSGLADGLSHELAPRGVSVTHVLFGYVDTEIYAHSPLPRKPGRWLSLTAEQAAPRVVSAIHRRARRYVLPFPTRMAILADRLFPGVIYSIIGRVYRRRGAIA